MQRQLARRTRNRYERLFRSRPDLFSGRQHWGQLNDSQKAVFSKTPEREYIAQLTAQVLERSVGGGKWPPQPDNFADMPPRFDPAILKDDPKGI